jgi:putative ABC transport system ATP-binding protein
MRTTEPTPLVRATGVSKTFGSGEGAVVAVHGVSCAVVPGAHIAITGPSGSGKSTLVHLLAGLEQPTTGTVEWPGIALTSGRPTHQVGLVFQGPSLLPPLNVVENVALPLVLQGVSETEATDRAHEALRALGVERLAGKLPEEVSGGQAQRVAVARVLAARPKLVMADEPTGQLDHVAAAHVVDVLLAATEQLGAALVIATHDPAVVRRLPTRWLLHDGTISAGAAGDWTASRS